MPNITLKNIPDKLYTKLKRVAKANHRSITGQMLYMLESELLDQRRSTEEILASAADLRQLTNGSRVTEEEINAAKNAGRPELG